MDLQDSNQYYPLVLKENIQLLESYKTLPHNWNYNEAEPFSGEIVEKVIRIIKKLKSQPQIFPTGRMSIQLEYEKDNGDYLEFEIFEDKILTYNELGGKEGDESSIDECSLFEKAKEFHG